MRVRSQCLRPCRFLWRRWESNHESYLPCSRPLHLLIPESGRTPLSHRLTTSSDGTPEVNGTRPASRSQTGRGDAVSLTSIHYGADGQMSRIGDRMSRVVGGWFTDEHGLSSVQRRIVSVIRECSRMSGNLCAAGDTCAGWKGTCLLDVRLFSAEREGDRRDALSVCAASQLLRAALNPCGLRSGAKGGSFLARPQYPG